MNQAGPCDLPDDFSYFLFILTVALVFVVMSTTISITISVPTSIAISAVVAVPTIAAVVRRVVAIPISMIVGIGNNKTEAVLLIFLQDGSL